VFGRSSTVWVKGEKERYAGREKEKSPVALERNRVLTELDGKEERKKKSERRADSSGKGGFKFPLRSRGKRKEKNSNRMTKKKKKKRTITGELVNQAASFLTTDKQWAEHGRKGRHSAVGHKKKARGSLLNKTKIQEDSLISEGKGGRARATLCFGGKEVSASDTKRRRP